MSPRATLPEACPSAVSLGLVLAGGGEPALRRRVVRHLLSGCADCRRAARAATGLEEADPAEAALPRLAEMMARLDGVRAELDAERERAATQMSSFAGHPVARQWTLLRNSSRFDSWAFAEQLSNLAFEAIYDDPHRSLEQSRMALEIVRRLDATRYGTALHDLTGRLLARLANAERAVGDLTAAEASLSEARAELEAGTGDPIEEAEWLYFLSSLRRGQRRLDDALRLVRRSRRLFRELGDRQREGRCCLAEGSIHEVAGALDKALDCSRRGLALIDEDRDPRLALAARHNVLWGLMQTGRAEEALRELEVLRPRYVAQQDRANLLKLGWMEGRLAHRLDQRERAEARLREACAGFIAAELPYDAAMVGLDLALLMAEERRHLEVAALGGELLAVFRSLGVSRETIAAWMVFEGAARAHQVDVALVERLAAFMAEARRRPGLSFELDRS